MADGVGIAVHHQESVFPARDHEMSGVVARLRRLGEEIRVAIFELEVIYPARGTRGLRSQLWETPYGSLGKNVSGSVAAEPRMSSAVFTGPVAGEAFGARTKNEYCGSSRAFSETSWS